MSVTGADSDSAPPTLDLGERGDSDGEGDGGYLPALDGEDFNTSDEDDDEDMENDSDESGVVGKKVSAFN